MCRYKNYISTSRRNIGLTNELDLGKLPPQALDLEESVLGALMLEKDALTDVIDILKPDNFYKDANKEIYNAIIDLFNNSEPVDLLTVTNQLKKNGKLDFVGGAYYVTQLTTRVNSASNIEYHARIILEQSIKRQLIEVSGEIQKEAYEDTTDVFDLLDHTEQSLFDISESHIRKNYSHLENELITTSDNLIIEDEQNEKFRAELNELKTTYESESVRINLLEKQSTEQNRQKQIIINVHQLKDSFIA